MELTSRDLFVLAWHAPLTQIAAEIGISSVALKKTYQKRGVPTPPRGHWSKIQAGALMPWPPMPTWNSTSGSLKVKPRSESILATLLKDAHASYAANSSLRAPIGTDDLKGAAEAAVAPDSARVVTETAATTASAGVNPPKTSSYLARTDLDSFRIFESQLSLLSLVQTYSQTLPPLDRLRIAAWLAQVRLELEAGDPARALISRVLGAA